MYKILISVVVIMVLVGCTSKPQPTKLDNFKSTLLLINFYGNDFFNSMTTHQQAFIINNQSKIIEATERYLKYPDLAGRLGISGTAIVTFVLHPDGSITELKIQTSSGYAILDNSSMEAIRLAYAKYPKPQISTNIKLMLRYVVVDKTTELKPQVEI